MCLNEGVLTKRQLERPTVVLENTKRWHEMEKAHRKDSTWKKTDVAHGAAAQSAYKLLTDAKYQTGHPLRLPARRHYLLPWFLSTSG